MFEDDAHLWGFAWLRRIASVFIAYATYVVFCPILTGYALSLADRYFPFVFFYHLQEGEADGPLGDPMLLISGLWIYTLLFWVIFAPIALHLRLKVKILVIGTFLNIVFLLMIPIWLMRLS